MNENTLWLLSAYVIKTASHEVRASIPEVEQAGNEMASVTAFRLLDAFDQLDRMDRANGIRIREIMRDATKGSRAAANQTDASVASTPTRSDR